MRTTAFIPFFNLLPLLGHICNRWAEVLSADAFNAFEEAGLDNEDAVRTTGRRFRDTVLVRVLLS